MSIYLEDIPLPKAKEVFKKALIDANLFNVLETEIIELNEFAVGRVLANHLTARISSPNYNSSAMDGFAVNTKDTINATITDPILLDYGKKAKYVDTGDPIPDHYNAVIPIEEVEAINETGGLAKNLRSPKKIKIRASIAPWKNIRFLGEDITLSQLLYVAGHEIRPVDLGVIAASGYSQIEVARKPRVAIIPTGSELIPIGELPRVGEILEFNSLVMASKVIQWGGIANRFPIIEDDKEKITNELVKAANNYDLVLINAGSSAGAEDFTSSVISRAGRVLVHGIAVRPGHPVIIGIVTIENKKIPVIGVPGFPVSAALTMDIFVRELINVWLGKEEFEDDLYTAKITKKITSPSGDDDFVRVLLAKVGEQKLASPLPRGAGVLTSLSQANGLIKIPSGIQGLEEGSNVCVKLLRPRAEIEKTILCMGSHDLLLEELTKFLAKKNRRLVSVNVGSLGGLLALNKNQCHLAGSHLLDGDTGKYNFSFIQRYINTFDPIIIALAFREQGLLVKKGNPKKIRKLEDISRNDISFVNRQRGSGTRILLDYHLEKDYIDPERINGYDQEEYTHLGIASAVISDRADCGLGIAAASQVYDLDFVPLFEERYDLIFNRDYFDSPLLMPLINSLNDTEFKKSLEGLAGYKVDIMGERMNDYKIIN